MNTRKKMRKQESEDSSCTLTPSNSGISCAESISAEDDEVAVSDGDDINSLRRKLECLKEKYVEKKLQNVVIKRSIEVENVSKFVNDLLSSNDPASEEQKRTIMKLYAQNNELSERLNSINEINKDLAKEIFELQIEVEKLMEKRTELWDQCVKLHKLSLGDSSAILDSDELEQPASDSQVRRKETDCLLKGIKRELVVNHHAIRRVSKILYNLITNSEVPWYEDESLMEILDCTSKILDNDFNVTNHEKLTELVDEIIHRLNKVKI